MTMLLGSGSPVGTPDRGTGLIVEDLSVRFPGGAARPFTLHNLNLVLEPGKIVGLAGESGCGKSTAALAMIGFNRGGETVTGRALFAGVDILQLPVEQRRRFWGNRICYVPQSAALALNPALTVGEQVAQPLRQHLGLSGKALWNRATELFALVSLPDPEGALGRYPFQFSGGQQQRIALAIALCCNPDVLILDEPTTGLDVTTQARISALLRQQVELSSIAALYVSHDLALLRGLADDLAIMYAGQIVEQGPTGTVIEHPAHPYTKLLLGLSPRIDDPRLIPGIPGIPPPGVILDRCAFDVRCPYAADQCRAGPVGLRSLIGSQQVRCVRAESLLTMTPEPVRLISTTTVGSPNPLLVVDRLTLHYPGARHPSVHDVSFEVVDRERVGIVGETGSGKSSILKMIAGLVPPSTGTIRFLGEPLAPRAVQRSRQVCQDVQLIFQNPDASLNPRHTIRRILSRPLAMFQPELGKAAREAEIAASLDQVRLPVGVLDRLPGDLSGGQRQRVAIARAFLARPRLLLCDEVTSALDVSVQAAILELIAELSAENGTAVVLVSHDLALVRTMADRTIVMRNGQIVEAQASEALFATPRAEYTRELLAAVPRLHASAPLDEAHFIRTTADTLKGSRK